MTRTDYDKIKSMAEKATGRTLDGRTQNTLLGLLEQNISQETQEQTGADYTITNPDLDTLAVNTTDGAVSVTIAPEFMVSGSNITISDVTNNAGTNNITVQTGDSTPINGQDPLVIDVDGGAATLEYASGSLLSGDAQLDITGTVGSIL